MLKTNIPVRIPVFSTFETIAAIQIIRPINEQIADIIVAAVNPASSSAKAEMNKNKIQASEAPVNILLAEIKGELLFMIFSRLFFYFLNAPIFHAVQSVKKMFLQIELAKADCGKGLPQSKLSLR